MPLARAPLVILTTVALAACGLQALTPLVEGIIGKDMERFKEHAAAEVAQKSNAA